VAQEGSLLSMIQALAVYRGSAATIFLALPILTFLIGIGLKRVSARGAGAFLTVPLHVTVLPGVCMSLTVAYLLFFTRDNLLANYDAVLFFGPIACMGLTLLAAWKVMPFDEIPGFDRLSGLMLISAVSFGLTYFVYRMAFRIWFFSSFETLVGLFLASFVLLKLGTSKMFGEPKRDRRESGDS